MSESDPPRSSRRDFLSGRSWVESLGAVFQKFLPSEMPVPSAITGPSRLQLVKLETRAMACQFSCLWPALERKHSSFVSDSLEIIHELEDQLSIYREHTELSRLNREGFANKIPVSESLYRLLKEAIHLSEVTEGTFNPVNRALTLLWRDARKHGSLPTETDVQHALAHSHPRDVLFDENDLAIQFLTPELSFDLGAIGKGYALDKATDFLKENGLTSFLYHGGQSSLYAGDPPPGAKGWMLSLKHPHNFDDQLGTLVVRNQAIGVSGAAVQFHEFNGVRYGHVIDPRTGWPSSGVLNSLVIAPTSAQADALATAIFVGGLETAKLCQKAIPGLAFILVLPTSTVLPKDTVMPDNNSVAKSFQVVVSGINRSDLSWDIDEKSVLFLEQDVWLT